MENTFVVSQETATQTVQSLLTQTAKGSVTVLDEDGNVLAYVLSPAEREELLYERARLDLKQHREEVQAALKRRGGITTKQLLEKAEAAAAQVGPSS